MTLCVRFADPARSVFIDRRLHFQRGKGSRWKSDDLPGARHCFRVVERSYTARAETFMGPPSPTGLRTGTRNL